MGDRAIRNDRLAVVFACLCAFALLIPAPAQAWGFFAHRITADIAEENISPQTRAQIRHLIRAENLLGTPECRLRTLQDASVWPDCVRRTRWRWGYTAVWHYRTTPICEAYNPRANCPGGGCVTAQIERNHRLLADESLPAHIRLEALAFMVHFAGDIHMPLHSGDRDDRGGNDRETDYGIVPSLNLHWIWDGPLAERAISDPNYPVVRRYSDEEKYGFDGLVRPAGVSGDYGPDEWGRESWKISREFVYPTAFDTDNVCDSEIPGRTRLSQEDIVQAVPIARRRVQNAGLRIAELLDSAFAPGPLTPPER